MNKEYMKYIVSLGGLTSIQYRILLLLNTGEYTQVYLGEKLNTHRANINKAIIVLKELKLIEISRREGKNIFLRAIKEDEVLKRSRLSNKELIQEAIDEFDSMCKHYGYEESRHIIGCYDKDIESLDKIELCNILGNITGDYTDVMVSKGKKKYIVEIAWVDGTEEGDEVDFNMISLEDYENKYGRKFNE